MESHRKYLLLLDFLLHEWVFKHYYAFCFIFLSFVFKFLCFCFASGTFYICLMKPYKKSQYLRQIKAELLRLKSKREQNLICPASHSSFQTHKTLLRFTNCCCFLRKRAWPFLVRFLSLSLQPQAQGLEIAVSLNRELTIHTQIYPWPWSHICSIELLFIRILINDK